jgi:hypothetical protein
MFKLSGERLAGQEAGWSVVSRPSERSRTTRSRHPQEVDIIRLRLIPTVTQA